MSEYDPAGSVWYCNCESCSYYNNHWRLNFGDGTHGGFRTEAEATQARADQARARAVPLRGDGPAAAADGPAAPASETV